MKVEDKIDMLNVCSNFLIIYSLFDFFFIFTENRLSGSFTVFS